MLQDLNDLLRIHARHIYQCIARLTDEILDFKPELLELDLCDLKQRYSLRLLLQVCLSCQYQGSLSVHVIYADRQPLTGQIVGEGYTQR